MLNPGCGHEPRKTPSRASYWVQTVEELGHGIVWKLPKLIVFLNVSMLRGAGVEPEAQATFPATWPHGSGLGNLRNSCGLMDKLFSCCLPLGVVGSCSMAKERAIQVFRYSGVQVSRCVIWLTRQDD